MREYIQKIINIEWKMFEGVNGKSKKADYAKEFTCFKLHRESQFYTWNEATLKSYYGDVTTAYNNNTNLITEKYAYMLSNAYPEEFLKLKRLLPVVSREKKELVATIIDAQLKWNEEIRQKYPKLAQMGRPLYSKEDTAEVTSFETYLRGELFTYSKNTLKEYINHINNLLAQEVNMAEQMLANTVKQRGYATLEEAEASIKL